MLTDSHCHLVKSLYENLDEVILAAKEKGITRFFNIGCNHEENREIISLIDKYSEMYGIIGIQPSDVTKAEKSHLEFIEQSLNKPKIIAIGEIGLEYHYGKDTKEEQKIWFEKQLQIAEKNNIPVVIHSRDAAEDTLDILKKYKVKGIVHSFTDSYEIAQEYIKLGFVLGINGVITFKNSNLKEVIKKVPLEYIVLETDCPYLTPDPFRGKKNEPKHIFEIANFISKLKGISLEKLTEKTNENLARIFDI